MRLSKGEVFSIICMIAISSLFIFLPMGHSEEMGHKLTVGGESASAAEPTWHLYQLAVNEGITPTAWTIYWRGSIPAEDETNFLVWLEEDLFIEQEKTTSRTPHGMEITEQIWKKEVGGTLHQVQVFNYPQKSKKMTNFIYTWSSKEMDQHWLDSYEETEQQLLTQLELEPQNFSSIEGIVNNKRKAEFLTQPTFDRWITKYLGGEIIDQVSDRNFTSINGYIPTWGDHFLSAGDQKLNVQLSARFNALEHQTRVTIGYPLILKEH